ncbi:conjugal transfer protein TrbL [Myceligenerans xiligouense]|uniref:TrbL/VirB6 plasmid conjugal transfer protein n=1 Tax=Myceligenerans xiligouense TaxID=253184 RepID=A0A3N4YK01_9MICO|nr:conjugal transfer protein TrbL [Myceligenerans xiligouense]RPF21449.1 hypothetical protein EDD34_2077 [Myceligenerans xiligouense]
MLCTDPITAPVCQAAAEQVATQAGSAALDLIDQLAQGLGGVASFLVRALWMLMDSTTMVDLSTGEFTQVYDLVFGIAVVLMLAFFLLQLITGMLRREPGALARAIGGLAKSVLGSFVVVTLTALLLEITDQICLALVHASGTSMEAMGEELVLVGSVSLVGSIATPLAGALLSLFVAGLAVAAALIVWFSLLMRKALLLVAVALAPLALAGASWDATRGWVARWAQFVVALILSKLVMVVVFLLATTLTASPVSGDLAGLADKLAGVALLLVAGFAPYITYKAIAFMGFDMYHAMSIEQEAKAALNRPMPVSTGSAVAGGIATRNVQKVLGPDAGKGASARGGAGGGAGASATTKVASAGSSAGGKAAVGKAAVAAGAGAATAGVAIPVMLGAQAAKSAAAAGPRAGRAVGSAAGQQATGASTTGTGTGTGTSGSAWNGARRKASAPAGPPKAPPLRNVPNVLGKGGDRR